MKASVQSVISRLSQKEVLAVALLAALCLFARFYAKQPLSGDEPHYLTIAQSLIQDGDLDLKNNYREQTYRPFYPAQLDPHVNSRQVSSGDNWYSIHGVELALYITPFFAVSKRAAPALAMVLVAWAVLWLTFRWSLSVTGRRAYAWFSIVVLGSSIFFLGLAGYIYPDMPMAGLLLGFILTATRPKLSVKSVLATSLIAALALWLHFKALLIFGPLLLMMAWRLKKSGAHKNQWLALIIPFGLSLVLFELTIYTWFGTWQPNRIIGDSVPLFAVSPFISIPAVAVDLAKGLFSNNPAYLLILPGLSVWYKRSRTTLVWALTAFVPAFLTQSAFVEWQGGFAPPGRYFTELLPVLLPSAGWLVSCWRNVWLRMFTVLVLTWQLILSAVYFGARVPLALPGPNSRLYGIIDDVLPVSWLFPRFTASTSPVDTASVYSLAIWVMVLALLFVWGRKLAKQAW